MKKIFLFVILFLSSFNFVKAEGVNLYFFWGDGCPHCAQEEIFLEEMKIKYPELKVYDFEVWYNRENVKKMQEVAKILNASVNGVPLTIIGDKYFVGFGEGVTDRQIENKIIECKENICEDTAGNVLGLNSNVENPKAEEIIPENEKFSVPIIGEFGAKNISLPFLTLILGLIDGFNPCAMWVLIFLITLLISIPDRRKRWILGLIFIVSSGIIYFMFMSLWLNLILFLGFIIYVRWGIGLLAIISGSLNLRSAYKDGAVCKIGDEVKKQKILDKLKNAVHQNSFWLSVIGIVAVSFAVNLIELLCSAGLPAIYVQVLTLNNLSVWQYYAYMSLYILFFMLDDILVFSVAMKTLEITKFSTKYSKLSKIIGGIVMIIIGFSLIFKPEWIMFG